ncbi:MAG: amino-acid N-acetyltransferase [Rhodocyclaceae bacterium]
MNTREEEGAGWGRTQIAAGRFVDWVRAAAPYIHAFRGRTFVIGFGGELLRESAQANAFACDCNLLAALGIRLVLVHGARPQIEAELARRSMRPHYHRGLRITDAGALECVKAATSVARVELEALLSQGLPNTPMAGAYMRVTGGNFIVAKPIGVVDGVDYQYTGAVRKVIGSEIVADLDQDNVVLISPLGFSPSAEVFNLSMEDVAEAVAVAIRADKLVYLYDPPGVLDAQGRLVTAMTAEQAEQHLAAHRDLSEDISLYLPCCARACRSGVGRAHLIERGADGGLLLEFFTHGGVGTIVTRDPIARLREASAEDVGAIVGIIAPLEEDGTLVRRGRELLEREIGRFSVLEHDGVVLGCAALYPFSDESSAELACLAVLPAFRRGGHGEQLLHYMEERARGAGIRRLFVLTTRTEHWFLERGFVAAGIEALPRSKRELYNYQRRSKVLIKAL